MTVRKILAINSAILLGLFAAPAAHANPAASSGRGSLLIFPNVEIKWDSAGNLIQDTVLTIANDYVSSVQIQMYFVNGDPPLDPIFGPTDDLIERRHPGWNHSGCGIKLSRFQVMFWSAVTGIPGACPFGILDSGSPLGRPDPDSPGDRMLRGFVYAWAVDLFGREINWNFLRGDAFIVNYSEGATWAYDAEAFRALAGSRGQTLPEPGVLRLDGDEYEWAFSTLRLNFFASGASEFFGGDRTVLVDTDLTLLPVSQDFRQDGDGPVTTKAKFDIWNMHEVRFSGTTRCITCWDQTLLSKYDPPNHFLLANLQTEIGTARVEGMASGVVCGPESVSDALLGVAARLITFTFGDWNTDGVVDLTDYAAFAACLESSGPGCPVPTDDCRTVFDLDEDGDVDLQDFQSSMLSSRRSRSYSGVVLVGEGVEEAVIRFDVP